VNSVLMLGSAGDIGRLLIRQFRNEGIEVTGCDVKLQERAPGFTPQLCDVTEPSPVLRSALQVSECTIVCLPETVALRLIPVLSSCREESLLIDTLSVKSRFSDGIRSVPSTIELLGINPMFAPDLGFAGRNVAVVQNRPGERTRWFLKLLDSWGASLSYVNPSDHDRLACQTQALTHAAILAFGYTLMKLNYSYQRASGLSTPPHRALLALLSRIVTGKPEVYWDIQAGNPEAEQARRLLAESCADLHTVVQSGDADGFTRFLERIRQGLDPAAEELSQAAIRMFLT
jgi:4-amino-4-deoxyprephenate dehydrogenase